jgi:peptide/nickel transport system permease protein
MSASWSLRTGILTLASICFVILFAGFFAPYDAAEQNRDFPYAPPMRLHWFDRDGHFHLSPFAYPWSRSGDSHEYTEETQDVPLRFLVSGVPYTIAGIIPCDWHLFGVAEPRRFFLLGTDGLGRDQWSRLLFGGQVTLLAGLLGTAMALFLAVPLGALAGYFGGWVDAVLMRLVELFLAMPWLYLLFAVRAFLPLHVRPQVAFLLVVLLTGVLGWARPARLIRGVARTAREREFVVAARSAGAGTSSIIARHILPQTASVVLTQAALLVPQYMLAEVTLSFLGLGVGEPVPSWGNMLQAVQQYPVLVNAWWMLAPGMAMIPIFYVSSVLVDRAHERVEFRDSWTMSAHDRLGT